MCEEGDNWVDQAGLVKGISNMLEDVKLLDLRSCSYSDLTSDQKEIIKEGLPAGATKWTDLPASHVVRNDNAAAFIEEAGLNAHTRGILRMLINRQKNCEFIIIPCE